MHERTWPPTPFSVSNINRNPSDPAFMVFIFHGIKFPHEASISVGWRISALLMYLSEFDPNDPCPDYTNDTSETFLVLDVNPYLQASVALCKQAITIFEHLVESWGAEEIMFKFGQGADIDRSQGSFQIGLRERRSEQ